MQTARYVFWQADHLWLGYLEEFPDYWTQGETFDDLVEHLEDIARSLSDGGFPTTTGTPPG